MQSGFLIGAIIFVSVLLAYDYLTGKRRAREFSQKINHLEAKLGELQAEDQQLKDQLTNKDKQLREAFEDSVTGLLGWQVFSDRVEQSIKNAKRQRVSTALMVIDIDDFSILNDAFGVEAGNEILREVGTRVVSCLRQVDSACRLSKDTFAVLLGQVSKPEAAVIAAQRILQTLAAPMNVKSYQLHLTACVGLSLSPEDSDNTDTLLRNADHALRAAKDKGRQTYQFYQDSMQARSQRELLLCTGLTSEKLFKELILQFRPILDVENKKTICMESVIGWKHPELGLVQSGELYQFAERQRKLNLITEWTLKQACQQFLRWRDEDVKTDLVSLPLTIKQLENSNFIYRLSLLMQEVGFPPEHLLVEIRDNAAITSFDILEKSFNMLKYLDVKIGIGSFGFSAMTLRYLRSLKISYIKLENVLIDDIGINERERMLVKSVMQFAKSMSVDVVAQGVQTEEQVELLVDMGCRLMQGNFIGRLQTGAEVIESMKKSEV